MNELNIIPLTDEDRRRLEPHVANWNKFSEIGLLKTITKEDVLKCLQIELSGKRRKFMVHRLIARYCSLLRNELKDLLEPCLVSKNNSKPRSAGGVKTTGTSGTSSPHPLDEVSLTALRSLLTALSYSWNSSGRATSRRRGKRQN